MRWHSASGARHEFRVMKFLCVECDRQMAFEERRLPGGGTLAAAFKGPGGGRGVALLTNPMGTQLVASLGVKNGGGGEREAAPGGGGGSGNTGEERGHAARAE